MGRGLSELQQTVLLLALLGREARTDGQASDGPPDADAYHDDILAEYWLWEPKPPPARARRAAKGRRFSQYAIGFDVYNNTHVVLSKAVARLVDRGLVVRVPRSGFQGAGVALTDAGVAASYDLLERLARPRPGPVRGGDDGEMGRGDLHAEGWRQFVSMLDRRHEKIRQEEEKQRRLRERVRQDEAERRREYERRQEEARQAQESQRRQEEERLRNINEQMRRALEEAERILRGIGQPRPPVLPPEVIAALDRLGVSYPCSEAELKAAYRRKALETHSDQGGSDPAFIAVKNAYDAAREYAS